MFRAIRGQFNVFCVGFAIAMAVYVFYEVGFDGLITGAIVAAIAGVVGNVGWFFWKRRGAAATPTDVRQ